MARQRTRAGTKKTARSTTGATKATRPGRGGRPSRDASPADEGGGSGSVLEKFRGKNPSVGMRFRMAMSAPKVALLTTITFGLVVASIILMINDNIAVGDMAEAKAKGVEKSWVVVTKDTQKSGKNTKYVVVLAERLPDRVRFDSTYTTEMQGWHFKDMPPAIDRINYVSEVGAWQDNYLEQVRPDLLRTDVQTVGKAFSDLAADPSSSYSQFLAGVLDRHTVDGFILEGRSADPKFYFPDVQSLQVDYVLTGIMLLVGLGVGVATWFAMNGYHREAMGGTPYYGWHETYGVKMQNRVVVELPNGTQLHVNGGTKDCDPVLIVTRKNKPILAEAIFDEQTLRALGREARDGGGERPTERGKRPSSDAGRPSGGDGEPRQRRTKSKKAKRPADGRRRGAGDIPDVNRPSRDSRGPARPTGSRTKKKKTTAMRPPASTRPAATPAPQAAPPPASYPAPPPVAAPPPAYPPQQPQGYPPHQPAPPPAGYPAQYPPQQYPPQQYPPNPQQYPYPPQQPPHDPRVGGQRPPRG